MSQRKPISLSMTETLRRAIADSGMTMLQLEQQSGVLRQALLKFSRGEQSLRLDMADKLAQFFELELVDRKRKGK